VDQLTEHAREAVSAVETAVRSDGWVVSADVQGAYVRISLDHALTNDDRSHLRFVNEALSAPEFAIIAQRPNNVEHPELLKSLRAAATANRWDSAILETVARVLEANGLLTEDESSWLEQAGHTWADPRPEGIRTVEGHS
jgi:hypothetical protein